MVPQPSENPLLLQQPKRQKRRVENESSIQTGNRNQSKQVQDERRKCRRCDGKEEAMKHVFDKCEAKEEDNHDWIQQFTGPRALSRMLNIKWKRKGKDKGHTNFNAAEE